MRSCFDHHYIFSGLGMSEVQLCNLFIEGIAQVIRWEQALEKGEDIEAQVAEAKPLGI